ncbi:hypothetical protein [Pseudomonas sp. dw_358]|uniref:hypothetical protein n=1 Tax=Pseudomonas sp. dw_358 TaxID=2720083 RepID=UPI001BD4A8CD|nr:hypothetical protein [Pseudomonas sp. dw_358]
MGVLHRLSGLALAVWLLAGCTSHPDEPPVTRAAKPTGAGCEQSDWQAQTAPVINKRLGPDVLEQYDAGQKGCP